MKFSDQILANQIKQFTEGLRNLESNLSGARDDFIKFAAETKTRGIPPFRGLSACLGTFGVNLPPDHRF